MVPNPMIYKTKLLYTPILQLDGKKMAFNSSTIAVDMLIIWYTRLVSSLFFP